MKNYHVAIIGGGVVGSAIAWELSKYKINVAVFEKGSDVCSGISKANSGVIHSGINSEPGSQKALFCVQGNKEMQKLSEKLGFSLKWTGKYVIARNDDELKTLEKLKKAGLKNKVSGLEIHDGSKVMKKEPNVECKSGLWVPTSGIILPYEFTIALAENAAINNVDFFLETKVIGLDKKNDLFVIKTNKGSFKSNLIINSAGLSCRKILSMLEKPDFNIYPNRGEYLVLDKNQSSLINSMIYPVPPEEFGVLGAHITPTIEGNILLGPSAEYITDSDDKKTTKKMQDALISEAKKIVPKISAEFVINGYSGIRCKLYASGQNKPTDYIIEESKQNPGFINLIGIESPGLTASPAIAKHVVKMISNKMDLIKKIDFKIKKKEKRFNELSQEQQELLIKKDSRFGRIVCRCEQITEAEIINALSNPLGAKTLSSVKYRCRAGMGRCQGGFCTQHIVRIMEDEFKISIKDMKLKSPGSYLFARRNREISK